MTTSSKLTTPGNILVTGASGQLGRLVINELLKIAPDVKVIGLVRNAAAAQDLADRGVELRVADYTDTISLTNAMSSVERVLLISSSEVGQRIAQHRNVVDAAREARVKFIAYTSILRADISPMDLAVEHRETENYIRKSGIPFAFLRNGWYTENYLASVASALQFGVLMGSAGEGRISSAARADYAAAAARVISGDLDNQRETIYEFAGDQAYSLAEFAAELAHQSGKPVAYRNLSQSDYKSTLINVGLPEYLAELLSESDAKAAAGSLYDNQRQLSNLIGRPTTTMAESIKIALAGL